MEFEGSNLTFKPRYDKEIEDIVVQNSTLVEFPKKKVFLVPGDKIEYVYYVYKGQTKHYMSNPDGLEKILYKLTSGWLFGETAHFLGKPTGLYSQAETDVVLRKMATPVVTMLFEKNKKFANYTMHCNCSKLLILRYEIENLTFNSCKDRIRRFYAASVDKKGITDPGWYDVKIHTTQYELGVIVGAARVTVTKLITELCDEKFLRIVNRTVQVNIKACDEYTKEFLVE